MNAETRRLTWLAFVAFVFALVALVLCGCTVL